MTCPRCDREEIFGRPCARDCDKPACNVDDNEGRCTANDGEPCDACAADIAADAAYYGAQFRAATTLEKDPARYAREMKDAGR